MPYYYNGNADAAKTFSRGNTLVTSLDSHVALAQQECRGVLAVTAD